MIKWSEFEENEVLYEAFLPEHEKEACEWRVRASCRGHVLAERRLTLTWPPRFGPDVGDVAGLEAVTDALINELAKTPLPVGDGSYTAAPTEMSAAEPILHAMLYSLIQQYAEAERFIGLTAEQTAEYLGLPVVANADGLYPFAVTKTRDGRMNRMIALAAVLKAKPETHPCKDALLAAVLADDILRLRGVLAAAGVDAGDG